jgi:hypothetical protein
MLFERFVQSSPFYFERIEDDVKNLSKLFAISALLALTICALAVVGCSAGGQDQPAANDDAAQATAADQSASQPTASQQDTAQQAAQQEGAAQQTADQQAQAIANAEAQGQIVVSGTLHVYSGQELCELQGYTEEAEFMTSEGSQYAVIELPQPTMLNVASSGDMGNLHENEATLVCVAWAEPEWDFADGDLESWSAYDGQTVTVALVPEETWWPSDVSLPIGQPRTSTATLLFVG